MSCTMIMITADMLTSFSIIRKCVFRFHEQENHGWHVPAPFNSQAVRNYFHFFPFQLRPDQGWLIPGILIFRKCVFIFHEQHNHVWHFLAPFFWLSAGVYSHSFVAALWLTCSRHFRLLGGAYLYFMSSTATIMADMFTPLDSQRVRNHILWAALWSRLTRSRHFQLLESAYLYFMSSKIMADMFPPLSTLRQCVIIPIPFATPSWLTCSHHFRLLGSGYLYFMSSKIMADMFPPLSTLRQCVIIPILFATTSRLIVLAIFDYQQVRIKYLMSSTIMADIFLPHSTLSGCVFPFHEEDHHGLRVPAVFDYQEVRIYISWAAQLWLTCSSTLTLSWCVIPFHELHHDHDHGWHVPVIFDY